MSVKQTGTITIINIFAIILINILKVVIILSCVISLHKHTIPADIARHVVRLNNVFTDQSDQTPV